MFEVYPTENLDKKTLNVLFNILKSLRGVEKVEYVDSEKGKKIFAQEFPEYKDLLLIFDEEVFPPKFTLHLKPYMLLIGEIQDLKSFILRLPFVKEVYFGEEYIIKVFKILLFLVFIDIFFFFFLLFLLSLTILQTLRLTIRSRINLIEILYLIGADKEYIRSPFALEGFLYGLFGSFLANLLLFTFINTLKKFFGITLDYLIPLLIINTAFGALLGFLSSQIALSDLKEI
ncbi:MAG: permease-like cell division protein FtsX [Candidatus Hydrothermales bacterium]